MQNPIDSLLYVKISAEQAGKIFEALESSIPLPIQLSEPGLKEDFKAENIKPEMILAGMLTVFAYDRKIQIFSITEKYLIYSVPISVKK